jgi:S1-C subfamily serine protease
MRARVATVLLALIVLPAAVDAAPSAREPRFDPRRAAALPTYVQRVQPALVALQVKAAPDRPSSTRLGAERFGTGIVFDASGYAVTVSYVVLDAIRIEARLHDGRVVPATVAGLDLDAGLAVVRLDGPGPWPVAELAPSSDLRSARPRARRAWTRTATSSTRAPP